MDVKFVHTTAAKVNSLPIVNGQVIALLDRDAYFYDLNGKRHPVTGLKFCGAKLPEYAGSPDTFYVVMPLTGSTEENRDLPGIYLWDPNKQGENATGAYVPIPSISNVVTTGEEDGNAITGISFDGVTATITKGKFTTYSDFQVHVDPNNKNPHGITAADLGLQNAITRPESELEVATAKKLAQKRTIQLSGDATGSAEFDGSDNASIQVNLKEITGVSGTHGPSDDQTLGSTSTFAIPYFTVDSNGRITAAGNRTMTINLDLGSADKLSTERAIDGVKFNGTKDISHRAVCTTAGSTVDKIAIIENFQLLAGSVIYLELQHANTAENATLNVGSTGSKFIKFNGENVKSDTLSAGVYTMLYDGTDWQVVRSPKDPTIKDGDGFTYHGLGTSVDWSNINSLINIGFNSGRTNVRITLVGNIGSDSSASTLNLNIADGKTLELNGANANLRYSGVLYNGISGGVIRCVDTILYKPSSNPVLKFTSVKAAEFDRCKFKGTTYSGSFIEVTAGILRIHGCEVGGSDLISIVQGANCYAHITDNRIYSGTTVHVGNTDKLLFSDNICDSSVTTSPVLSMQYNNLIVSSN